MLQQAQAPAQVVQQFAAIEAALDDVVNYGTDEELFIASYLQGHFAVEAKLLEMNPSASLSLLDNKMHESLDNAFSNNELEPSDAAQVRALWQRLLDMAKN